MTTCLLVLILLRAMHEAPEVTPKSKSYLPLLLRSLNPQKQIKPIVSIFLLIPSFPKGLIPEPFVVIVALILLSFSTNFLKCAIAHELDLLLRA